MEEIFESLQEYYNENDEKYFLSLMKAETETSRTVRNTPQAINRQNMNNYLIKDNALHNLIVGLFALVDSKITITEEYLSFIEDPFHLLVELLVRYN